MAERAERLRLYAARGDDACARAPDRVRVDRDRGGRGRGDADQLGARAARARGGGAAAEHRRPIRDRARRRDGRPTGRPRPAGTPAGLPPHCSRSPSFLQPRWDSWRSSREAARRCRRPHRDCASSPSCRTRRSTAWRASPSAPLFERCSYRYYAERVVGMRPTAWAESVGGSAAPCTRPRSETLSIARSSSSTSPVEPPRGARDARPLVVPAVTDPGSHRGVARRRACRSAGRRIAALEGFGSSGRSLQARRRAAERPPRRVVAVGWRGARRRLQDQRARRARSRRDRGGRIPGNGASTPLPACAPVPSAWRSRTSSSRHRKRWSPSFTLPTSRCSSESSGRRSPGSGAATSARRRAVRLLGVPCAQPRVRGPDLGAYPDELALPS